MADTRRAGAYRISWEEGPLGTQQDLYASNPDPRESQLERIEPSDLKTLMEPLDVEVISARNGNAALASSTGREIWHDLAAGLLILMVLEAVFATWVGPVPVKFFCPWA